MTGPTRILLIDSSTSDLELASLLLQQAFPRAEISGASSTTALLGFLRGTMPEIVIVAPRPHWVGLDDVPGLVRSIWPRSALILFGRKDEITRFAQGPASALDGIANKSSAGFMALPTLVRTILDRIPTPSVALDDWRLPAVRASADGHSPACTPAPAANESASMRELQDMALIFSHDLKEPMQQVARLVRRLEDTRGSDSRSEDKLLRQLSDCAARATGMLDGLLAYLSISGRTTKPEPVDLNLCLDEAMGNLCSAIEESQARISADPLPSVLGDAVQLVHLFQNLLGNAIKYRSCAAPLVRITCRTHGNVHRIAVHDNGIGISEAHRERVFEMGKRLHTQAEFPGTGMGLTLCRRITERHGGSIHIEAAPRGGSVVVVELPQDVTATAASAASARVHTS